MLACDDRLPIIWKKCRKKTTIWRTLIMLAIHARFWYDEPNSATNAGIQNCRRCRYLYIAVVHTRSIDSGSNDHSTDLLHAITAQTATNRFFLCCSFFFMFFGLRRAMLIIPSCVLKSGYVFILWQFLVPAKNNWTVKCFAWDASPLWPCTFLGSNFVFSFPFTLKHFSIFVDGTEIDEATNNDFHELTV